MKLHEIADAGNSTRQDELKPGYVKPFKTHLGKWTNLDTLKHLIVSGQQPEIANAFYTAKGFAWGDLQKLGFAKQQGDRQNGVDLMWWTYTGPNTIALITDTAAIDKGNVTHGRNKQIMKTGDSTSPEEMDYS